MSSTTITGWRSPWQDLRTNLTRNRRAMLMAFLGTSSLFGCVALLMPPSYKAESVLMVRLGPEYLVNADPANTAAFAENRLIQASEAAMLTAPELIVKVIDNVGLQRLYPALANEADPQDAQSVHDARERALLRFSKHLSALPGKESTLIDVTYANADPFVAGQALQKLVEGYLEMRRKHFEYASGTALSIELQSTKQRLADTTGSVDGLRRRAGITDFDTQLARMFNEKSDLVTLRDKALAEIAGFSAQVTSLRAGLDRIGASVPLRTESSESPALRAVKTADAELRLKENDLSVSFKPGAPQLLDARRHVDLTWPLLEAYAHDPSLAIVTGRPEAYDRVQGTLNEAEANLASSRARLDVVSGQIAAVDSSISGLEANQSILHQLQREQKVAEDAFFQAGRRVTEAAAHDQMMEAAKPNVVVVQTARVPFKETPTRLIVAALGVVLGIMFAALLAYVDDMGRRRTFPAA